MAPDGPAVYWAAPPWRPSIALHVRVLHAHVPTYCQGTVASSKVPSLQVYHATVGAQPTSPLSKHASQSSSKQGTQLHRSQVPRQHLRQILRFLRFTDLLWGCDHRNLSDGAPHDRKLARYRAPFRARLPSCMIMSMITRGPAGFPRTVAAPAPSLSRATTVRAHAHSAAGALVSPDDAARSVLHEHCSEVFSPVHEVTVRSKLPHGHR